MCKYVKFLSLLITLFLYLVHFRSCALVTITSTLAYTGTCHTIHVTVCLHVRWGLCCQSRLNSVKLYILQWVGKNFPYLSCTKNNSRTVQYFARFNSLVCVVICSQPRSPRFSLAAVRSRFGVYVFVNMKQYTFSAQRLCSLRYTNFSLGFTIFCNTLWTWYRTGKNDIGVSLIIRVAPNSPLTQACVSEYHGTRKEEMIWHFYSRISAIC